MRFQGTTFNQQHEPSYGIALFNRRYEKKPLKPTIYAVSQRVKQILGSWGGGGGWGAVGGGV